MKKRTNPVIEMVNSDVTTSTVSTLREVGDQTIIVYYNNNNNNKIINFFIRTY